MRERTRVRRLMVAIVVAATGSAVPAALASGAPRATPVPPPPSSNLARGLVFSGLRTAVDGGPCGTSAVYEIWKGRRFLGCTHGPDPAPPGVDVRSRRTTAQLRQGAASADAASIPCIGNGISGNRVQAMYIHAADVVDRYATVAPLIQTWAAGVNDAMNASAAETGGQRQIRFVTASCQLSILDVQVTATGDDSFANTISDLRSLGYVASSRKYLAWVDANVYCGVGQLYFDDQPGAANQNNGDPTIQGMVARIDNACWGELSADGAVESHEIMHTLGAVQLSSPNHSAFNHCNDEYEVMCYADGSPGLVLRYPCPIDHDRLYDCRHDDYFSTNPPGGSYLATHWDTASSSFLATGLAPPNDAFASAEPLAAARGAWVGSDIGGTAEPGEPNPTGVGGGRSIWYRVDAPAGATVLTVDTQTSTFDTVLGIYTGSVVSGLTEVAANDDAATGVTYSRVSAPITGSTTYFIEVDGKGSAGGSVTLHVGVGGPAPEIATISPATAAVGKKVTLTGINFFGGSYAYLRFNGVYPIQSDYLSYSSTKIVIKVPAGAFSGPISVITEYGQSQTTTPFKVKPTIKSFAPASGAVGTAVTINGSAFLDATGVTFGGVPASFVLVSYWKISATVPAGANTGKIVVTTPSGKATSKTDFTVT